MGMLIGFELRKILGNRAGMVSCALVLAMFLALTVLNYTTSVTRDFFGTGDGFFVPMRGFGTKNPSPVPWSPVP